MKIKELPLAKASDLASTRPEETVPQVARELTDRNIGALPVVDKSGNLVGIISERDIVQCFAESNGAINGKTVSDLMTTDVVTCSSEDDVSVIMEMMDDNKFRHIPVLDNGRLHSIISSRDVMTEGLRESKAHIKNLGLAYETVR